MYQPCMVIVILLILKLLLFSVPFVTDRRSVAKRGGVFSGVCLFVSVFVRTITSGRLNVGRSNLAVRCIVQKSRSNSMVKVKDQGHRGQKNEKLLTHPH